MSDAAQVALAAHHVRRGRDIVASQRALIARLRAAGRDTDREESLFRTFEDTLVIFEDDLQRLEAKDAPT